MYLGLLGLIIENRCFHRFLLQMSVLRILWLMLTMKRVVQELFMSTLPTNTRILKLIM